MKVFAAIVALSLLGMPVFVASHSGGGSAGGIVPVKLADYVIWPLRADKLSKGVVRIQAVTLNKGDDAKPGENSLTRIIADGVAKDFPIPPLNKDGSTLSVWDVNCTPGRLVFVNAYADFSSGVEESVETNNAAATRVVC